MHAVIKIISFIVFGAAVSTGNGQVILAGMLLVAPLFFFTEQHNAQGAMTMLKRLRWLFVSIFVVYLFFTPGQLLFPDVLWGPTLEGVMQGVHRILALMLLIAAVNLLLTTTEQEDFLSAVLWCLRPLSLFGISHERLAIRITLTLDTVSQVREDLTGKASSVNLAATGSASDSKPGSKLFVIAGTADRLFTSTISSAEKATLREIALPEETTPPWWQWFVPVILSCLLAFIHNIKPGDLV